MHCNGLLSNEMLYHIPAISTSLEIESWVSPAVCFEQLPTSENPIVNDSQIVCVPVSSMKETLAAVENDLNGDLMRF